MKYRTLSFPKDEGRHTNTTEEWWYLNCHLSSEEDSKEYGLVVCFFPKYTLSILIDSSERRLIHRGVETGKLLEASSSYLDLRYGANWWRVTTTSPTEYQMHFATDNFVVDLTMNPTKQPLLLNRNGIIKEGLLGYSYYYANTRLDVAGTLEIGNRRVRVKGLGWIDRQWGKWDWSGLGGWNWFSIQLGNNVEIAGIQISHSLMDGFVFQSFNISDAEGKADVLENLSVKQGKAWRSPKTNVTYCTRWSLTSKDLFEIELESVLDDQEINRGLWEGECLVHGAFGGNQVTGHAYVEQSNTRVYNMTYKRFVFLALGVIDLLAAKLGLNFRIGGWALAKLSKLKV